MVASDDELRGSALPVPAGRHDGSVSVPHGGRAGHPMGNRLSLSLTDGSHRISTQCRIS